MGGLRRGIGLSATLIVETRFSVEYIASTIFLYAIASFS